MDIYTQLQDKLNDMALRITHEARYFQAIELAGSADARERVRLPLLEEPFVENEGSLAMRAQCSANALVSLNQHFDRLLGTLPADEGEEAAQLLVLEELAQENVAAGEVLEEETAHAEAMLIKLREAMTVVGDDRSRDVMQQLQHHTALAARGLDPGAHVPPSSALLDPPASTPAPDDLIP